MKRTDTKALAAAIEAFEAEFPTMRWNIAQSSGVMVMRDFEVTASSFAKDPVRGLAECATQLRELNARRFVKQQHAVAMTAEYGPEVAA